MIVKSFLLKQDTIRQIAAQCGKGIVAVVRPEKQIENILREAIRKTILEKKSAAEEIEQVRSYFRALSDSPAYQEKAAQIIDSISAYLREGMYVMASKIAIQDYVMARCARLCAEAVNDRVGGVLVDGTELMLCHEDGRGVQHFDWIRSQEQIRARVAAEGSMVISGGYGLLDSGYVVRVGKDGSHLMASLIGATLKAESIVFYIEGKGIEGIPAMTYDEAAHFCASASHAPFASSAIWPAKNAEIPILVKDITDAAFEGTIISTGSAHKRDVIWDKDLTLVTVYGTGLLGRVGMSSSIFSCLAKEGVNVRFIAQTSSEYSISFAVRTEDKERTQNALQSLFRDNPLLPLDDVVVLNKEVGIVTVFGSRMRNLPGTSGQVFGALGSAGINIIASAQGGEELSISLVVEEKDVEKAVSLLKN
ncbi:MAG: ACT domain-containing protein [Bacteroidales bacterium]|nr:ACT domain-containing protein [Bacteroidales bacterium]